MKNICFLSGDISRSGGTERVASDIANGLVKSFEDKYNVFILSLTKDSSKNFYKLEPVIKDDVLYDKQPNFKFDYFSVVLKLRKYLKCNKIDILVDVDVSLDLFSIPATRFTKIKLISWEHFNFYENLGMKLRDISRKLAARFSDYIVTITKEDKGYFEQNLKLKCPICNIYNPIKTDTDYGEYSYDSNIIISAGRLTYQKGFDILVDVAKIVFYKHPHWVWYILGEGSDRAFIEEKIKQMNLENNVILKGEVKDIDNYYKQAAMFVLTSRFEGFGLVLAEAKSYNLPTISFKCKAGPSEIIIDEINGNLIECFNIEEMAKSICNLIENQDKRIFFSKNALDGMNKFEIKKIVNEWDLLLDNL